ncbi:MAG: two pore domain potassium channel family protein [Sphaerospermopsis sp. SIO1G2]|nr:two pore domain potassium channel family protein [Sphaerospermopsis sp. SIO1G2]
MTALRSTNLWFFLILSLNFWLVPLLPQEVADDVFTDDLLTMTLLAAVIFQGLSRPNIRLWAVGAVLLILIARSIEEVLPGVRFVENATYAVCFASVAFLYFHAMTKTLNDVTFDTVLAAACAYILIGMVFASVFGLIVEADPTAIKASSETVGSSDLLFYSFATITTLGSADLVPTTDLARMMTAFEAIIGLIYVAILVGAVVGSYSARMAAGGD